MRPQRDAAYWAAWLVFLTAVALLSRSYLPIDETRYLSVAWEMWQRGDFLVPYKNGEPYSHKPPLLFWLIHAGWAVTGVNDWWPRLISPLLSFACLFLVRRLALTLWPDRPEVARLAPWILLGSLLWGLYSQTLMFDLLLAFCTLVSLLGLVRAARGLAFGWGLFALGAGVGLLAKGPAIFLHLLPGALLAPWWLGRPPQGWQRWYGHLAIALLLAAALVLLWAIPAGLAGGQSYRQAIFWGQTAHRMVQSFAHQRPFWWYGPWLPLLLFPWFVWPALWRGLKGVGLSGDHGLKLVLAWMLPAFLAFSFISGKQVHYLLPEFPAFALLAARLLAPQTAPSRPWPVALVLGTLAGLTFLAPHLDPAASDYTLNQVPTWAGGVFLLLAGAAGRLKGRPAALVPRLAAVALSTLAALHLLWVRPLFPVYDVRPLAAAIAKAQAAGRPVAHLGTYHAQYQFAGRLRYALAELDSGFALGDWLRRHPQGVVVMYFPRTTNLTPFQPLFTQPYRGRQAALLDGPHALAALGRSETRAESPAEE